MNWGLIDAGTAAEWIEVQTLPAARRPQCTRPVSRLTWSEAMKRTFKLDVLQSDRCDGRREVIALIPEGVIATRILAHLKLPVDAEGCLPSLSVLQQNRPIWAVDAPIGRR